MTDQPQIPTFDPRFECFDGEWNFRLRLLRRYNCEYERRYEPIANPDPELRPIIAAVAVLAWEREGRRYGALVNEILDIKRDYHNATHRRGANYQRKSALVEQFLWSAMRYAIRLRDEAFTNARQWRTWGGWE